MSIPSILGQFIYTPRTTTGKQLALGIQEWWANMKAVRLWITGKGPRPEWHQFALFYVVGITLLMIFSAVKAYQTKKSGENDGTDAQTFSQRLSNLSTKALHKILYKLFAHRDVAYFEKVRQDYESILLGETLRQEKRKQMLNDDKEKSGKYDTFAAFSNPLFYVDVLWPKLVRTLSAYINISNVQGDPIWTRWANNIRKWNLKWKYQIGQEAGKYKDANISFEEMTSTIKQKHKEEVPGLLKTLEQTGQTLKEIVKQDPVKTRLTAALTDLGIDAPAISFRILDNPHLNKEDRELLVEKLTAYKTKKATSFSNQTMDMILPEQKQLDEELLGGTEAKTIEIKVQSMSQRDLKKWQSLLQKHIETIERQIQSWDQMDISTLPTDTVHHPLLLKATILQTSSIYLQWYKTALNIVTTARDLSLMTAGSSCEVAQKTLFQQLQGFIQEWLSMQTQLGHCRELSQTLKEKNIPISADPLLKNCLLTVVREQPQLYKAVVEADDGYGDVNDYYNQFKRDSWRLPQRVEFLCTLASEAKKAGLNLTMDEMASYLEQFNPGITGIVALTNMWPSQVFLSERENTAHWKSSYMSSWNLPLEEEKELWHLVGMDQENYETWLQEQTVWDTEKEEKLRTQLETLLNTVTNHREKLKHISYYSFYPLPKKGGEWEGGVDKGWTYNTPKEPKRLQLVQYRAFVLRYLKLKAIEIQLFLKLLKQTERLVKSTQMQQQDKYKTDAQFLAQHKQRIQETITLMKRLRQVKQGAIGCIREDYAKCYAPEKEDQ